MPAGWIAVATASVYHLFASPMIPPLDLHVGEHLGRYLVEGVIGQGGMGRVYRAFDPELNRRVALKLLLPGGSSNNTEIRLIREAQAMALLAHPNVVSVYDVGRHEGHVFVAMELVEGTNLKEWLTRSKRDWREVLRIFIAAAEGLAAAHRAGLIHRDFKPANVLLGEDGRARVADFGIARSSAGRSDEQVVSGEPAHRAPQGALATPLTARGALIGTIGYLAPDGALGIDVDPRADQFSFCASLYEALCGKRPYATSNVIAYFEGIQRGLPAAQPSTVKMPNWLYRALCRGLAAKPEHRYPDMRALIDVLERGLARRRRVAMGATAMLVLGATALLAVRPWTQALRDCGAEAAEIDKAWNSVARGRIAKTLASTGRPDAEITVGLISASLDSYVDRWKQQTRSTCDQMVAGEPKAIEAGLLPSMRLCLNQRRLDLQALVEVLAQANDKGTLGGLIGAARRLDDPRRCSDARVLRTTGVATPLDSQQRAFAARLAGPLARARALSLSGRTIQVVELGKQIEREAAAHDLLNEQAEALWLQALGGLANDQPSPKDLTRAQALALRAGNLELAVRAGTSLALSTVRVKGSAGAREILESLRPLVAGLDDASPVLVTVRAAEAELTLTEGNPRRAVELYQQAVELGRKLLGADHPEVLFRELQLSTALGASGDSSTAHELEQALLKRIEAALGTECDDYCWALNNLGASSTTLGRYGEALDLFARTRQCQRALYGEVPAVSVASARQAYVLARMDRGREALALADQAMVSARPERNEDSVIGMFYTVRAWARLAAGQPEAGLDDCRKGLQIDEKVKGKPDSSDLLCEGRALLALGRARDAVTSLERAVVLNAADASLASDPSDLHFALARALWSSKRDPARAKQLAEQALRELEKLPDRQRDRKEIVGFLNRTTKTVLATGHD